VRHAWPRDPAPLAACHHGPATGEGQGEGDEREREREEPLRQVRELEERGGGVGGAALPWDLKARGIGGDVVSGECDAVKP
jgi:hypothetical protein